MKLELKDGKTLDVKFWSFFGAFIMCYLTVLAFFFAAGFIIGLTTV